MEWRSWLLGVLLVAAFVYVLILPLFRPRGDLLWGRYHLKDIYLGIPIALITLCVVIILLVPKHLRRSLSLRLTSVAISFLVALAVCDAGYAFGVMGAWRADFWLDQAHIPRRYSIADAELGFIRKPNVSWQGYVPDVNRIVEYRTDENGFRNTPGQAQADVIFIGDSFTEAATVAEEATFVRRVAQLTGLRTINLARGAYGPQQELIVLKRYGLPLRPRAIVWQLFEGNDLEDARLFAEWRKNPHNVKTSLRERYFNNSLLNELLENTRRRSNRPIATLKYTDGTSRRISLRYRYEPEQPASNPLGMAETMSAIEAGHRACQMQGIPLLVVFVPTMVRVMAPNISFDSVQDHITYLPEKKSKDQKDFSVAIEQLCARIGCSSVDSSAALQEAAAHHNRNLYIPNDGHFDVGAHDVVAKIVVDWLRSANITSAAGEVKTNELYSQKGPHE